MNSSGFFDDLDHQAGPDYAWSSGTTRVKFVPWFIHAKSFDCSLCVSQSSPLTIHCSSVYSKRIYSSVCLLFKCFIIHVVTKIRIVQITALSTPPSDLKLGLRRTFRYRFFTQSTGFVCGILIVAKWRLCSDHYWRKGSMTLRPSLEMFLMITALAFIAVRRLKWNVFTMCLMNN